MQITIDEMQAHHLPYCLDIEQQVFPHPWGRDDFVEARNNPVWELYVATYEHVVAGYIAVEKHLCHFRIWNLAVCEAVRRQGVGGLLVNHIVNMLGDPRSLQSSVETIVRASNANLIEFYQSCGFEAIKPVLHDLYRDPIEDGYIFQRKFCVTVGTFIDDELESAE